MRVATDSAWLFPGEQHFPPGFAYYPDFLSSTEELDLLARMRELELHNFVYQGHTANRRSAGFGKRFSFETGQVTDGAPIPEHFRWLLERVAISPQVARLRLRPEDFTHLLATYYPPGAQINWHRDAGPFGIICGVSLSTDCNFRLRPYPDKNKPPSSLESRARVVSMHVARRSLYVMSGPSRSAWQHSITPVAAERWSITMRTFR